MKRAIVHDMSKYSKAESSAFAKNIFKLKKTVYGTPEYQVLLDELGPALDHHYRKNSHHPEHWKHGIKDMGPLDELEMLVDWKSATRRMKRAGIHSSIEKNAKRFKYTQNKKRGYLRDVNEMF
jgi:hypothetical protein